MFVLCVVSEEYKRIRKILVGDEIFRTRSYRPWGPPSPLYNEFRVSFPGAKRPGRDVKERVQLYLHCLSWPVLGRTLPLPLLILSCVSVHFIVVRPVFKFWFAVCFDLFRHTQVVTIQRLSNKELMEWRQKTKVRAFVSFFMSCRLHTFLRFGLGIDRQCYRAPSSPFGISGIRKADRFLSSSLLLRA